MSFEKLEAKYFQKFEAVINRLSSYVGFNFHVPGQNPPSLDGKL
jgi:hypothetical protein